MLQEEGSAWETPRNKLNLFHHFPLFTKRGFTLERLREIAEPGVVSDIRTILKSSLGKDATGTGLGLSLLELAALELALD